MQILARLRVQRSGSLAGNVALSTVATFATIFSGVALLAVAGRTLTVKDFGVLGLIITATTIFGLLPAQGFDVFFIRELTREHFRREHVVASAIVIKLGLGLLSLILLWLYVSQSNFTGQAIAFGLIGISTVCLSLTTLFTSISKAEDNFWPDSWAKMITGLLLLAFLFIVAWQGETSVTHIAWLLLISRIVGLAVSMIILPVKQQIGARSAWDIFPVMSLIKGSLPFILQSLMVQASLQTDTMIMGILTDPTGLGYYQAGMRFMTTLLFIPPILSSAFYPKIARNFAANAQQIDLSADRFLFHFLFLLGGLLAIPLLTMAQSIVVAFFGVKMMPAAPIVRILSVALWARFAAMGYEPTLTSAGYQSVQLIVSIVAWIINAGLNLILLPRYGFIAAAWVGTGTSLVILSIYAIAMKKVLGTVLWSGMPASIASGWRYARSLIRRTIGISKVSV